MNAKEYSAEVRALSEVRQNLELLGQVSGELQHGASVNVGMAVGLTEQDQQDLEYGRRRRAAGSMDDKALRTGREEILRVLEEEPDDPAQNLFKAAKGDVAAFEGARTDLVKSLYRMAAKETSQARKRELLDFAFQLDGLAIEDIRKNAGSAAVDLSKVVIGSHDRRRNFAERHGF